MEEHSSLKPTTTKQEDLTTSGQRRVNLIWEVTQSAIAVMIVMANVVAALVKDEVPTVLSSSLFMVLGFYLARTNHQAIGSTGDKPTQPYIGR